MGPSLAISDGASDGRHHWLITGYNKRCYFRTLAGAGGLDAITHPPNHPTTLTLSRPWQSRTLWAHSTRRVLSLNHRLHDARVHGYAALWWDPALATRLRCRQPVPFQDVVVSEGSYLVVQHNLLHAKGNTPNVLLSGSVRHRLFARARLGRSRVHTFSEFEQPGLHPGAD